MTEEEVDVCGWKKQEEAERSEWADSEVTEGQWMRKRKMRKNGFKRHTGDGGRIHFGWFKWHAC